jgi:hypothetical protein
VGTEHRCNPRTSGSAHQFSKWVLNALFARFSNRRLAMEERRAPSPDRCGRHPALSLREWGNSLHTGAPPEGPLTPPHRYAGAAIGRQDPIKVGSHHGQIANNYAIISMALALEGV